MEVERVIEECDQARDCEMTNPLEVQETRVIEESIDLCEESIQSIVFLIRGQHQEISICASIVLEYALHDQHQSSSTCDIS